MKRLVGEEHQQGQSAELSERTIPPNEYKRRYSRQAQRDFNRNQVRAMREVRFIKRVKAREKTNA